MPIRLDSRAADFAASFRAFLAAKREAMADVEAAARSIIADIAVRGDAALIELSRRFDGVDLDRLDGKRTVDITPPKSNWANTIDAPPFEGYAVTCGLTFTFGGLRITTDAEVLNTDYAPIRGLYAAGELVGGLFYFNYPGGSGLTSGAVFGRIAGSAAARAGRN